MPKTRSLTVSLLNNVEKTSLSKEIIIKNLRYAKVFDVETKGKVVSTNDIVKERIAQGAKEGLVVVADSQTKGRGTKGRSFFSPKGTGIYASILVCPTLSVAPYLTAMTAVSVAKAIENLNGNEPAIKWVNDVYVKNKKCAGILTEAVSEGSSVLHAVIGIGVNVVEPVGGFPDEVKDIAGVAFDVNTEGLKEKLVAEILNVFYELYSNFNKEYVLKEYKSHSFLLGKCVVVVSHSGEKPACVLDVDDEFRLVVKYDDGSVESINSGEVKVVW